MRQVVTELLERLRSEEDVVKVSSILHQLVREEQVPLVQVSKELGAKPSYVSHLMRIRKLPSIIIDGYYSKSLSLSHLFIISRLSNIEDMVRVYEKVLGGSLPTSKTEELVREILFKVDSKGERIEKDKIETIKEKYKKRHVDLEVIQTRTKGKIVVEMKGNLEKTSKFIEELIQVLDLEDSLEHQGHSGTDSLSDPFDSQESNDKIPAL